MKKLLICLFLMCSLSAFSKEYSEVVEVEGKTTDQLYSSAREWFAETFKSATDVLQMDDPIAGKLIGKGITTVYESYSAGGMVKIPINVTYNVRFTLKIFVKEGRFKYDISNLMIQSGSVINGQQIKGDERSFESYLNDSEYYKNASDANWLIADFKAKGKRMGKAAARQISASNKATLAFIDETDVNIQGIIKSLKTAMLKAEDNW